MISPATQAACDNAIRTARRGDTRSGIGLARHAYRLARHENPEAELEALNALGLCQSVHGSFIEAIATGIDACRLGRQIGNRRGVAFSLCTIATAAAFILDANDIAFDILNFCLGEAEVLADDALRTRAFLGRGLVCRMQGKFDEADADYDRALALLQTTDERAGMMTPPYLVAGNKTHLSVLRWEAADSVQRAALSAATEASVQRAITVAAAEGNIEAESRALFCLGQLRAAQGRDVEAMAAFRMTQAHAEQIHHNARRIDTIIAISNLHRDAGRNEEQLEALELAYELADANRPTSKIAVICKALAAGYEKLGRGRDAAHYHARATREAEAFARESDLTIRDLNAFWRPV